MADFAIATGVAVVSNFLLNLLTGTKDDTSTSIDTPDLPKASYGSAIPRVYGRRVRLNGTNLVWAKNIRKKKKKKKQKRGKGLGGSETTTVEVKFYGTWANQWCAGEIEQIYRIWVSNKLMADLRPKSLRNKSETDEDLEFEESTEWVDDNLEIFFGTANQLPSGYIQQNEGEDAPAWRNLSYGVFHDLGLKDFGNSIPKIDVEVVPTIKTLSGCIQDICNLLEIGDRIFCDPSLNYEIEGAIWNQDNSPASNFLENLQLAYGFRTIEKEDGLIHFIPLENEQIKLIIEPEAIIPTGDSGGVEEIYPDLIELPSRIEVKYINPDNNHDPGVQYAFAPQANHVNEINYDLGICLSDQDALTIANKLLNWAWGNSRTYKFKLPPSFLGQATLGRLLQLNLLDGRSIDCQIELARIGRDYDLEIEAIYYSKGALLPVLSAPSAVYGVSTTTVYGEAIPIPLDLAVLADQDPDNILYMSLSGLETWEGSILVSTNQADWNEIIFDAEVGTVGEVIVLPWLNSSPTLIDYASSIRVQLSSGALESVSDEEFYSFTQLAILGDEIIAFKDAILVADNTYELRVLARGLYSTENEIASHNLGERFVLLQDKAEEVEIVEGGFSNLGQTLYFKAVPDGKSFDYANSTVVAKYIEGNAAKAYTPVHCNANSTLSGDIIITAFVRARRLNYWRENIDITPEATQVVIDVIANGEIVRSLFTPVGEHGKIEAVYTASMQTNDGAFDYFTVAVFDNIIGRHRSALL